MPRDATPVLFGRVGEGNLHLNVLRCDDRQEASIYPAVMELIAAAAATSVPEHGVGSRKRVYLLHVPTAGRHRRHADHQGQPWIRSAISTRQCCSAEARRAGRKSMSDIESADQLVVDLREPERSSVRQCADHEHGGEHPEQCDECRQRIDCDIAAANGLCRNTGRFMTSVPPVAAPPRAAGIRRRRART